MTSVYNRASLGQTKNKKKKIPFTYQATSEPLKSQQNMFSILI